MRLLRVNLFIILFLVVCAVAYLTYKAISFDRVYPSPLPPIQENQIVD